MPARIIIEINSDDYRIWHEHTIDLTAQMNATKCKNKKEVIKEVEKLLLELEKEEDPFYNYHGHYDD